MASDDLSQPAAGLAPTVAQRSAAAPDRARIDLLLGLALLHAEHGQPRRALTYALLAQTFAPADPMTRRMLAFALLRNGAAQEALDMLAPLVVDGAAQPEVELLRAEALRALDQPDAASDAFWRAISARVPAETAAPAAARRRFA